MPRTGVSCLPPRWSGSARTTATEGLTARNRFRGIVRSVEVDGLLARVEIDVTEPARVVAIVTRESVEELGLAAGHERRRRRQVDERDGGAVSARGLRAARRRRRRGSDRCRADRGAGDRRPGNRPRGCVPHRGAAADRRIGAGVLRRLEPARAAGSPGLPVRRLPLGEPPVHAGAVRRGPRPQAGRLRDQQPRPHRAAPEPGQDHDRSPTSPGVRSSGSWSRARRCPSGSTPVRS